MKETYLTKGEDGSQYPRAFLLRQLDILRSNMRIAEESSSPDVGDWREELKFEQKRK